MIYMKAADGTVIIVINQGNLAKLKEGKPLITPLEDVLVVYQPDLMWTSDRLQKASKEIKTAHDIDVIFKEGMKQPIKIIHETSYYEMIKVDVPPDKEQ